MTKTVKRDRPAATPTPSKTSAAPSSRRGPSDQIDDAFPVTGLAWFGAKGWRWS
jgi:hypothetical protein